MKTLLVKFLILIIVFFVFQPAFAFHESIGKKLHHKSPRISRRNIKYGTASFYADKFLARSTASGEKYHHRKYTAACNVYPLNQWIKVTNLRNGKSVILRINDRLSRKSKRIVDVSQSAAKILGFTAKGITKVKLELLKSYRSN